ncbi:hypothetical protein GHT06_014756 [Daphnia sinensis]|uniref:Uncharacterized protein n=1 Tax=Daphnia sinensis TaxID=1820382 RepID=A0AAD5LHV8_9CRUS|nr:hypothetical protein GHT06_014756 [Daphnia sinensis]
MLRNPSVLVMLAISVVLLAFLIEAKPVDTSSNPCHTTNVEKKWNEGPLKHKRVIITNGTEVLNLCNFNTTEKNICLPDFEEWKSIHAAWHCQGKSVITLGQSIFHYLDKHSHSREQCDKSPSTCNWCRVGKDVEDYLNLLMDNVAELCPLFTTDQLVQTGSSAEKTNIFRASEFDHLAILKHFSQSPSDPNEIIYTGSDPVTLKYANGPVNASELLNLFRKCITEAVELVQNDVLSSPKIILGRTGVTIYFIHGGRYPLEPMKISVDLSIGVKIAQQPPVIWFMKNNSNNDVILVPQRPDAGSQWRLTYPTLERDMLLRADASVGRVYQLLKFLAALHHSKDNIEREIPRKSSLTSYVLKTCLFSYMRRNYRPEEATWYAKDALHHAVGVLGHFPLNATEMTSFFFKDRVEFNITLESKQAATEIIAMLNRINP